MKKAIAPKLCRTAPATGPFFLIPHSFAGIIRHPHGLINAPDHSSEDGIDESSDTKAEENPPIEPDFAAIRIPHFLSDDGAEEIIETYEEAVDEGMVLPKVPCNRSIQPAHHFGRWAKYQPVGPVVTSETRNAARNPRLRPLVEKFFGLIQYHIGAKVDVFLKCLLPKYFRKTSR